MAFISKLVQLFLFLVESFKTENIYVTSIIYVHSMFKARKSKWIECELAHTLHMGSNACVCVCAGILL